jgi:hypothetical protein
VRLCHPTGDSIGSKSALARNVSSDITPVKMMPAHFVQLFVQCPAGVSQMPQSISFPADCARRTKVIDTTTGAPPRSGDNSIANAHECDIFKEI